jgi:hypothetical protein
LRRFWIGPERPAKPPSDEQARREVEIYLKAWQAMNPGVRADLIA